VLICVAYARLVTLKARVTHRMYEPKQAKNSNPPTS